jgi:uncharacterized protein
MRPSPPSADAPALYATSVPVFQHYLERLAHIVQKAQQHNAGRELLHAQLAPNMLPFHNQVEIATNFSLRACFPLAGLPLPGYGEFAATWDGLHERINRAQKLLADLPMAAFEAAAARSVTDPAGQATVTLGAQDFLQRYALPNFLFHISMTYAIARHCGVPLGKADFDGLHSYG